MEDIEIVNNPSMKSTEENEVDNKQKAISPCVTRMKATSTTSSPDLVTENPGARKKKKRAYLSREQKEREEKLLAISIDTEKTNRRISHELPKCNWLEEKLKEIEKNEVRRSSLDRMIEEELSRRKSITSGSEKQEQEPKAGVASASAAGGSDGSPAPVQSNQHQTELTPSRAPVMDQELVDLQDKLVQQKESLLKDIRVIQKRKIKELDELYQIKLKKQDFEKELDKTKEDIKKMEDYFHSNIKQRATQQQQQQTQTTEPLEAVNNERLPSPMTKAPSPHTLKPNQELIRVRPNMSLMADRTQPPPRQEAGRPRSVWHIESQLQLPRPADPGPHHTMPQLQQRRLSGDSSHSFSPDQRPCDPAEHLQRLTEDARKSFQPYKPQHDLRRSVEPQAGQAGYGHHPVSEPGADQGGERRPLPGQLTDSALASHLLEYYRSLGLLPPGPRLPPELQGSPGLVRPTPLTPGHSAATRAEALPGYHDPRHHHQTAAYISGLEKLLIQENAQKQHSAIVGSVMNRNYKGELNQLRDHQRHVSNEHQRTSGDKCDGCGRDANFMCSACRGAHYCSNECQKEQWLSHSKVCNAKLQ